MFDMLKFPYDIPIIHEKAEELLVQAENGIHNAYVKAEGVYLGLNPNPAVHPVFLFDRTKTMQPNVFETPAKTSARYDAIFDLVTV